MNATELLDLYADLRRQWAARNGEYGVARLRYLGQHWDAATNPAPQNRYSLTLNYLKPIVDKSVQGLMGRLPGVQCLPPGVSEEANKLAEQVEGIIYGTWFGNDAERCFQKVAHDSFVLRRGLVYVWADRPAKRVRFRSVVPDNYFPMLDGDETVEAVYVSRRLTKQLQKENPKQAANIVEDVGSPYPAMVDADPNRLIQKGVTTVIDWFDRDGNTARLMGDVFMEQHKQYPFGEVPFLEFPCFALGAEREPANLFDQFVELNQYLDQLVSQKADVIKKYSNPTIIAKDTGQSPQDIRNTVSGDGGVLPIKATGDVSLLNWQGTPPAIEEQIALVMDALFDLSGKPRTAFGQTITNQSGVQTNLALNPTIQSNDFHESVWGGKLVQLNEWCLQLWEEISPSTPIIFRGRGPTGIGDATVYYETAVTGAEIGGWYKNRIKWPSATRTDDPAYVQMILAQMTASPHPTLSLISGLEELGVEDAQAEADRIVMQLEDPRLYPDRMTAMLGAAQTVAQGVMPGMNEMEAAGGAAAPAAAPVAPVDPYAFDPGVDAPPGMSPEAMQSNALSVAGSPVADQVMQRGGF